jgi:hypothetical protein
MGMRVKNSNGNYKVVTANFHNGGGISRGMSASGSAQSTSYLLGADLKSNMLEGYLEENNPKQVQAIYRDIYHHDAIAGAAVDLKATLPWSDFTLVGISDEKVLNDFNDNIERLNLKTLSPELSTDQMVTGAFVGSLIYDPKQKEFSDVIPYDYGDCEVTPVPLYSTDPIIKLNINEELRNFANNQTEEALRIKKRIPNEILERFKVDKELELSALSTIYVPRATLSNTQIGVSYYRRLLPIYLLERVLYRGTLAEATRRQRSTLHITAGDEDWIPNEDELGAIVGLFQSTESDPISSVVATRSNIMTSEIRSGGDFWKWTDGADQFGYMKMRALGINETFLSGDASYNSMETAFTVFIEELRTYRERTTRQVYYDKLFPLISRLKGYTRDSNEKVSKEHAAYLQDVGKRLNDTGNLLIPEIQYRKSLRPDVDRDQLEMLEMLGEKGVPIPLKMWAVAGGLSMDKIMSDLEDDKEIRKKIKAVTGKDEADEDLDGMFASLRPSLARLVTRDYGDDSELSVFDEHGKKRHIPSARAKNFNARLNDMVLSSLRSISDPNNYEDAKNRAK